ncbi:MAG: DUF1294 domain-containing protein [Brachymonas sp.]
MGSERWQGRVARFDDARGFGFVRLDDVQRARRLLGRTEIFVHWRAFPDRQHRPQPGDRVSLGLVRDHQGGWQGHNVEFLAPQPETGAPRRQATGPESAIRGRPAAPAGGAAGRRQAARSAPGERGVPPGRTGAGRRTGRPMPSPLPQWFWPIEAGALLLWGMVLMQPHLSNGLVVGFAGLSVLTFLVYAIDKTRAQRRRWRIPEKQLHVLSLAGGWPGALAAQQLLRHKNAKPEFQSVFWATVAGHVLAVLGLCWHAASLGAP